MILDEHIETFIYTNKYALLNQIGARIKSLNVNYFIPSNINDYLYEGDLYGIGLIYMINDKSNLIGRYIGQDKNCRNLRKGEHIRKAKSLFRNNKHLSDNHYNILINLDRYDDDFEYKILELVVYKTVYSLNEREQYYIDKFDTYINGLNSSLLIKDKIKLRERMKRTKYFAFTRYSDAIRRKVKLFNEYFKYNGDYKFYKKYSKTIKRQSYIFIDTYIYDKI